MENASESITSLAGALLGVQADLRPMTKDATNAFTHSKYATLACVMDSCRSALQKHGIVLMQLPVRSGEPGLLVLETRLIHAKSGEYIGSYTEVPLPKNDPQGLGAAMTYTRRYALCAMLGMVADEDDDCESCKLDIPRSNTYQQAQQAPPPRKESYPQIEGVSFEPALDEASGRNILIAHGSTRSRITELKSAGFRWNPTAKFWWRYREAA